MGRLGLRNTLNSLKHNNFKINVMFKQQISFFTVFHSMCMHLLLIKRHLRTFAPIHHQHHHTLVNPQQQSVSLQPFISPPVTQQSQAEFPQLDFGLAVPTFQKGDDLIDCINKAMLLSFVAIKSFAGTGNRGIATTLKGNYAVGQAKVVKCYNYLEKVHMAKQCTQPKKPRSSAWLSRSYVTEHKKLVNLGEEQTAFIATLE
ncbi:hypothetical protein Tco_0144778 [Tanacetum coccineum]